MNTCCKCLHASVDYLHVSLYNRNHNAHVNQFHVIIIIYSSWVKVRVRSLAFSHHHYVSYRKTGTQRCTEGSHLTFLTFPKRREYVCVCVHLCAYLFLCVHKCSCVFVYVCAAESTQFADYHCLATLANISPPYPILS